MPFARPALPPHQPVVSRFVAQPLPRAGASLPLASAVQRIPVTEAPTPEPEPAPAAEMATLHEITGVPTVARAVEEATSGPAAGQAAPAAPAAEANPDETVKKLFDPLLRQLRTELRLDRERRGVLTDLGH